MVLVAAIAIIVTAAVLGTRGRRVAVAPTPSPSSLPSPASAAAYTLPATPVFIADARGYVYRIGIDGVLSIIAGNGNAIDPPTPGPATASPLSPVDLAVDVEGNVFVADANGYVDKVSPDGELTILAGAGNGGTPGPGPALSRHLSPIGIAVDDGGSVYIADSLGFVEKVTPDGALSIVTGNGHGERVLPGPAAASPISPLGVMVDASGNLLVAVGFGCDLGGCVVQVTPRGVLSILTGSDSAMSTSPRSLALDSSGNLYVTSDGFLHKAAPDGTSVVVGSGVLPGMYRQMLASGIAVDRDDNLYVADGTGYVDMIARDGTISTIAGRGDTKGTPAAGPAANSPMRPRAVAVQQTPVAVGPSSKAGGH